jgi:hypothetical protein
MNSRIKGWVLLIALMSIIAILGFTMPSPKQTIRATAANNADKWDAMVVSYNLFSRSMVVNARDVGTFNASISRSVDVGTPSAPKISVGDRVLVMRMTNGYLVTEIVEKAATQTFNLFLPYVSQGIGTPEWVSPYPRFEGANLAGVWTVVGEAIKYQVYSNSTPSQVGATLVGEFVQNQFSVGNTGGQGENVGVNRGFENGDMSNGWIVGVIGADPTMIAFDSLKPWAGFAASNTITHSGSYSAKQSYDYTVNTDATYGPGAWGLFSNYTRIVGGQPYTFSLWYKITSVSGVPDVTIEVTQFDANKNSLKLSGGYWISSGLNNVADWTQLQTNITMLANAAYVQIHVYIADGRYNTVTYYVDDFSLYGAVPNLSASTLYAVRAVGAGGMLSPFSSWQQPTHVQATLGDVATAHAVIDPVGAIYKSSNYVPGTAGYLISPLGIDGLFLSGGTVAGHTHVDGETPSGLINGANLTYSLANAPSPATSLKLFLNGIRLTAGAGNDYTLSGSTITLATAPSAGDVLIADYTV